jgi:DNA-binding CsgD family transcriptional regulator
MPQRLSEALQICVGLAALSPQPSADLFVAAGLEPMARALGATGGHFGLASRRRPPVGDPLQGFRLDVYYGFGARFSDELTQADELLQSEAYIHDPGVQVTASEAGRHRIYHDPDPRTEPSRADWIDVHTWSLFQLVDRLKLVYAMTPDAELHFAFDRGPGCRPYEVDDIAMLETLTRGLEPWGRRVALLHGCLDGRTLLSTRERALACALLGHAPLKNVARELEVSEARARELARSVYRKLRVNGRLGLAAAWAAVPSDTAFAPISAALRRRRA